MYYTYDLKAKVEVFYQYDVFNVQLEIVDRDNGSLVSESCDVLPINNI